MDGSTLVLAGRPGGSGLSQISVIYPDGSCLDCQTAYATSPAFTAIPGVLTAVRYGRVVRYGTDGIGRGVLAGGGVGQAVSSTRGRLAIVRRDHVYVSARRGARPVAAGDDPAWSPGGDRFAVADDGWIETVDVASGRTHRLAKGGSATWSPNGQQIAFIAPGHMVSVISATGGRPQIIGGLRGVSVNWQPTPATPIAHCQTPPGSTVLANSAAASVTIARRGAGSAVMGCPANTGRVRLLQQFLSQTDESEAGVLSGAVAGQYAALMTHGVDLHYGGSEEDVEVFDVDSGRLVPSLGGESNQCQDYDYGCTSSMDDLVINSHGFTAALAWRAGDQGNGEQVLASDSTGVHVLDSTPADDLSDLTLTGDTLSWLDNGQLHTALLS